MATPPFPVQFQPVYVERDEISETFVDSLVKVFFDGANVRMEFVVNRMAAPQPNAAPTGKAITASRVVIPLPGFVDMLMKAQGITNQLKAQGVI